MEIFVAQLWGGLVSGSVYALTAVSVTFLMVVAGFIQFAHGEVVVMAMYIAWLCLKKTGGSMAVAVLVSIVAAALMTISLEPLTRRLRKTKSKVECLILTVAAGMILTEMMAHFFNHGMPVRFAAAQNSPTFNLGLMTINSANLYIMAGCIVALGGFSYMLYHTKYGQAMRAVAIDMNKACMLGIPIHKVTLLSFAITGVMAGVTAVLFALALGFAAPSLGSVLSLRILAVMLFAGLGNFKGAVVCGLLLGIIESLCTGYLSGAWTDALSMGLIMLTVIFRPKGLFGTKV